MDVTTFRESLSRAGLAGTALFLCLTASAHAGEGVIEDDAFYFVVAGVTDFVGFDIFTGGVSTTNTVVVTEIGGNQVQQTFSLGFPGAFFGMIADQPIQDVSVYSSSANFSLDNVTIPEPGSLALATLGVLALALARRASVDAEPRTARSWAGRPRRAGGKA